MFLLDKGSQLLLYLYRERYTYTWLTVSSVSGPRTLLVKYNVYIAIYSWGNMMFLFLYHTLKEASLGLSLCAWPKTLCDGISPIESLSD